MANSPYKMGAVNNRGRPWPLFRNGYPPRAGHSVPGLRRGLSIPAFASYPMRAMPLLWQKMQFWLGHMGGKNLSQGRKQYAVGILWLYDSLLALKAFPHPVWVHEVPERANRRYRRPISGFPALSARLIPDLYRDPHHPSTILPSSFLYPMPRTAPLPGKIVDG